MEQLAKREAEKREKSKTTRVTYVSPAIVYEGKLTIRAGSPPPPGNSPFEGPPSPFSRPGG